MARNWCADCGYRPEPIVAGPEQSQAVVPVPVEQPQAVVDPLLKALDEKITLSLAGKKRKAG